MGYYLEYMCTYYKSFLIFSSLQHSINFSTWIYWKLMVLLSPKNIKIVLKNELSLQLWMSFHHLLNTDLHSLNMLHCLLLWISNFHHIKKQSFFVKYLPPCHTNPDYLASHHFWPLQTECLKKHLCPLSCQHPSLLVGSLS